MILDQCSDRQRESLTAATDMSFSVEERGRPNTQDYRVFFSKHSHSDGSLCVLVWGCSLFWIVHSVTVASFTSYVATPTVITEVRTRDPGAS